MTIFLIHLNENKIIHCVFLEKQCKLDFYLLYSNDEHLEYT